MKVFTPSELPVVIKRLISERGLSRMSLSVKSGLARRTIDILSSGEHSSRVATVADALHALGYDLYLVAVEVGQPRPELVSRADFDQVVSSLELFRDSTGVDEDYKSAVDALETLGIKEG